MVLVALTAGSVTRAADMSPSGIKAPVAPSSAWSGFYVGAHFGYAGGWSDWAATGAAPSLSGSLDLFNMFEAFKGTGSYFSGLQAGYSHVFPSRLVLGVEADVSFPNSIAGSQTIVSPFIGQASYAETLELSGTLRGRLGYAADHWLVYGTADLLGDTHQAPKARDTLGGTTVEHDRELAQSVIGWGPAPV
jgi:high affinity Mn2+ porin